MKRFSLAVLVLLGLAAVNAAVDARKTCYCFGDCWCHKPGLRHFRWLVPLGHHEGDAEDPD